VVIKKRQSKITTAINMTPLIDVVFILLIFFMLTSSMVQENSHNINSPEAISGSELEKSKTIIEIDSNANIYIKDKELDQNLLKEFIIANPNKKYAIKPDSSLNFQDFVNVFDLLKSNNIKDISLITIKK